MNEKWVTCWKCSTRYALPPELYAAAKRQSSISIWCPYGHSAHYPDGDTVEDQMRRERDLARQDLARVDEKRLAAEKRAAAAEKRERLLKRRTAAGACPCCQRSFANMARHMRSQHPQYVSDEQAKIIPLKVKA